MLTSTEDIKIGICKKLSSVFGDSYSIYTEEITQGLEPPAFFIKNIRSSQIQGVGKRYYKSNLFIVNFFPVEDNTEMSQCNEVADKLFDALKYIEEGAVIIRGTNMSSEVVDKVLNFSIEFNFPIINSTRQDDFMSTLIIKQNKEVN